MFCSFDVSDVTQRRKKGSLKRLQSRQTVHMRSERSTTIKQGYKMIIEGKLVQNAGLLTKQWDGITLPLFCLA